MTGTTSTTGSVDGTGTSMGDETSTGEGSESSTGGEPPSTFEECFEGQFVNEATVLPDYDQYEPVIGSHCVGTNHQDIEGIERVVFLGDSITVGSRPTLPGDVYRARLGDMLRDAYGLSYGDAISEALWKAPNPFSGEVAQMTAGDFTSCSRWGARNDDLPVGVGNQLEDCFGPQTLDQRTLVVMTSGGNDVSALAQDAIDGVPLPDLWMAAEDFVMLKREAVEWITAPGRFTSGVFVVFANIYEFTDGTGDVMSCDVSGLAGFDQPVPNPMELTELVVWANEQYMSIAVDTGTDMQFLLETFCGHGFANDDPTSPCYRGPGTPRWFDLTCIHPNPEGHGVIADQFMAIIEE
ncbi:SGNH/GDSL hydrolase family protein [Paraliomyxa miuraensis]|uniref:SGNH/GDSL hydrolase family protein n=1 Tax=Paraliomyxa miuraensis TaxID=376150 RepID=UPI0022547C53|nr:SGNH/GDSL hydrolase family protein [Paraliomyxa miuraensis]MCX4245107.1 SGNH/GDSL hydrolase family protein [Paraliomyxa miuraensis]